jgi:hypothetical protein
MYNYYRPKHLHYFNIFKIMHPVVLIYKIINKQINIEHKFIKYL